MQTVTLAPHEFHANLLYNDDGLAPFFACDSAVKRAGGSTDAQFQHDGEQWRARLSYQSSNIVHPGNQTPQGTDWQLQQMREYRIKVYRDPEEDPVGEQDFTAHVAPRWDGMKGETNDGRRVDIPVPDGFGEGINVRVTGSNIAFDRYVDLLTRWSVRWVLSACLLAITAALLELTEFVERVDGYHTRSENGRGESKGKLI